MNQDIRVNKSMFHFDNESKTWGIWQLISPEFTSLKDAVDYNKNKKVSQPLSNVRGKQE